MGWGLGAFAVGALIGAALWRPGYGYGYGYPAYGYGYPAYGYGYGYPAYRRLSGLWLRLRFPVRIRRRLLSGLLRLCLSAVTPGAAGGLSVSLAIARFRLGSNGKRRALPQSATQRSVVCIGGLRPAAWPTCDGPAHSVSFSIVPARYCYFTSGRTYGSF